MAHLTTAQVADILRVTDRQVANLIDSDAPDPLPYHMEGKGRAFDCKTFGQWFERRALAGVGVGEDGKTYDYQVERARLTKEQADKTSLEVSVLRGDLLRVDEVVATWQSEVAAMRAKLLSLPTKMAHVCLAAESLSDIDANLREVIYEALQELSDDGLPNTARDKRDQASAEATAESDGEPVGRPAKKTVKRKQRGTGKLAN